MAKEKPPITDFLGATLAVGDEIVFVSSPGGRRHLVKGFITAVNGKTVSVGQEKNAKYCGWAYPNQVLKITQGIPEGTEIVDSKYLAGVIKDADHLHQLKNAGVDNWSEYFSYRDPEEYCEECGLHLDDCECEVIKKNE